MQFCVKGVENLENYQLVLENYGNGELGGKLLPDGQVLLKGFEARVYFEEP